MGVEPDVSAAACTYRNLALNKPSNGRTSERFALLVSHFDRELIGGEFDLIACNPPYIPDPPAGIADRSRHRTGAVAGLALIDQLLSAAPTLLSTHGRLLLIVSSVTPPGYVRDRIPAGLTIAEEPFGERGKDVLFEVEEVFSRPGYLSFLETEGGIDTAEHSYTHRLHAFWIEREE